MKVQHYQAVAPIKVEDIEHATQGVAIRRVISEVDGAQQSTMEVFEIEPGGHSRFHTHPWEHEVFVIRGQGTLVGPEGEMAFREGDVIFVASDEPHQFRNTGDSPVEFVCLVPRAALTAYYMERVAAEAAPNQAE